MVQITTCRPKTYLGHPNQKKVRDFLCKLLEDTTQEGMEFLLHDLFATFPLPMSDVPFIQGAYSRTILYRAENGYEAIAVRWCKDVVTAVHGHPRFSFYYIAEGRLRIENYERSDETIRMTGSKIYCPGDYFCLRGEEETFDNNIHRVIVEEEGLSLHVYSGDALKGEVFNTLSR